MLVFEVPFLYFHENKAQLYCLPPPLNSADLRRSNHRLYFTKKNHTTEDEHDGKCGDMIQNTKIKITLAWNFVAMIEKVFSFFYFSFFFFPKNPSYPAILSWGPVLP